MNTVGCTWNVRDEEKAYSMEASGWTLSQWIHGYWMLMES